MQIKLYLVYFTSTIITGSKKGGLGGVTIGHLTLEVNWLTVILGAMAIMGTVTSITLAIALKKASRKPVTSTTATQGPPVRIVLIKLHLHRIQGGQLVQVRYLNLIIN